MDNTTIEGIIYRDAEPLKHVSMHFCFCFIRLMIAFSMRVLSIVIKLCRRFMFYIPVDLALSANERKEIIAHKTREQEM